MSGDKSQANNKSLSDEVLSEPLMQNASPQGDENFHSAKDIISEWANDVPKMTNNTSANPTQSVREQTEIIETPTEFMSADSGKTDAELSDIFGESDSIFGAVYPTEPLYWDPTGMWMDRLKCLYANYLIWLILCQHSGFYQSSPGSETAEKETSASAAQESNRSRPSNSQGKRKVVNIPNDDNFHNGNQDSDDDDSQPTRPNKKLNSDSHATLRFACPFFKRYPENFQHCGLADYENSSRVKQHIQRKHRRPIYCPKCSEVFKSEKEQDGHIRADTCVKGGEESWIYATLEQLDKLGKRSTGKSDRDNWDKIYNTLFPNARLPGSPYLDSTISAELNYLREVFLNTAPIALHKAIELAIPSQYRDLCAADLEDRLSSVNLSIFERIFNELRADKIPLQTQRSPVTSKRRLNKPQAIAQSQASSNLGPGSSVQQIESPSASRSESQSASCCPVGGIEAVNEGTGAVALVGIDEQVSDYLEESITERNSSSELLSNSLSFCPNCELFNNLEESNLQRDPLLTSLFNECRLCSFCGF